MGKKYTFENGAPDILDVKMTYGEFAELVADAWIIALEYEEEPHPMFRKALFYSLDKLVATNKPNTTKGE